MFICFWMCLCDVLAYNFKTRSHHQNSFSSGFLLIGLISIVLFCYLELGAVMLCMWEFPVWLSVSWWCQSGLRGRQEPGGGNHSHFKTADWESEWVLHKRWEQLSLMEPSSLSKCFTDFILDPWSSAPGEQLLYHNRTELKQADDVIHCCHLHTKYNNNKGLITAWKCYILYISSWPLCYGRGL